MNHLPTGDSHETLIQFVQENEERQVEISGNTCLILTYPQKLEIFHDNTLFFKHVQAPSNICRHHFFAALR